MGWDLVTTAQVAAAAAVAGIVLQLVRWVIDARRDRRRTAPKFFWAVAPTVNAAGWRSGVLYIRNREELPLIIERIDIVQPAGGVLSFGVPDGSGNSVVPKSTDAPGWTSKSGLSWNVQSGTSPAASNWSSRFAIFSKSAGDQADLAINLTYLSTETNRRHTTPVKSVTVAA